MGRRNGDGGSVQPASPQAGALHTEIINHQSSIINGRGFTLIELLVVISVVALLMAILLPTLQAVRKQAQATGCQAQLRQWGLYYSMYTQENEYKMPSLYSRFGPGIPAVLPVEFFADAYTDENDLGYRRLLEGARLLLCPATRFQPPGSARSLTPCQNGTTRLAWSLPSDTIGPSGFYGSSYAQNTWISWDPAGDDSPPTWTSCLQKGAAAVPVYSDCRGARALPVALDPPPPYEDAPVELISALGCYVMNRHNGGINSLCMDWSVRKVGLKQLWTLKWALDFDTAGPWTQAGGVPPEHWPPWMRRFKDY